ncbi:GNAT family N-acetyltransferase [Methyloceanibacter sp.]|uniref:GNAT family N-acetyltransferase n=1 Tax=Methyloceanibacter sp. TaxID=1965321 RepID=UPI003C70D0DF
MCTSRCSNASRRGPEPHVGSTRVALSADDAQGFYTVRGNQVYLLFIALAFWRQGLGSYLLCAAEAALARRSYRVAWLGCDRGNSTTANFYEGLGWRRRRTFLEEHARDEDRRSILLEACRY